MLGEVPGFVRVLLGFKIHPIVMFGWRIYATHRKHCFSVLALFYCFACWSGLPVRPWVTTNFFFFSDVFNPCPWTRSWSLHFQAGGVVFFLITPSLCFSRRWESYSKTNQASGQLLMSRWPKKRFTWVQIWRRPVCSLLHLWTWPRVMVI